MERKDIHALKEFARRLTLENADLVLGDYELNASGTIGTGIKIKIVSSLRHGDGLPEHWISVDPKTGLIQIYQKVVSKNEPLIFFWLAWGVFRFSAKDNMDADNKAIELLKIEYPDFNKQELADDFVSAVSQRQNGLNMARATEIVLALGFEKELNEIVSPKPVEVVQEDAAIIQPQKSADTWESSPFRFILFIGIIYGVCYLFNIGRHVTMMDYLGTVIIALALRFVFFGGFNRKK